MLFMTQIKSYDMLRGEKRNRSQIRIVKHPRVANIAVHMLGGNQIYC